MIDSFKECLVSYALSRRILAQRKQDVDELTVPGLRSWRTQRKLSLRAAAKLLNVSFSFLSKVETGQPGYPITKDLAEKLLENWE